MYVATRDKYSICFTKVHWWLSVAVAVSATLLYMLLPLIIYVKIAFELSLLFITLGVFCVSYVNLLFNTVELINEVKVKKELIWCGKKCMSALTEFHFTWGAAPNAIDCWNLKVVAIEHSGVCHQTNSVLSQFLRHHLKYKVPASISTGSHHYFQ